MVEVFAWRLQSRETLTVQGAAAIQQALEPPAVGAVAEAAHRCVITRGIREPGVSMVAGRLLRAPRDNPVTRRELRARIGTSGTAAG